jgi:hypothetical protein
MNPRMIAPARGGNKLQLKAPPQGLLMGLFAPRLGDEGVHVRGVAFAEEAVPPGLSGDRHYSNNFIIKIPHEESYGRKYPLTKRIFRAKMSGDREKTVDSREF